MEKFLTTKEPEEGMTEFVHLEFGDFFSRIFDMELPYLSS